MAFTMKLSITPNTRRVLALRNLADAAIIINDATAAPRIADTAIEAPWNMPPDIAIPPPASVATAAPSDAPELIPIM